MDTRYVVFVFLSCFILPPESKAAFEIIHYYQTVHIGRKKKKKDKFLKSNATIRKIILHR